MLPITTISGQFCIFITCSRTCHLFQARLLLWYWSCKLSFHNLLFGESCICYSGIDLWHFLLIYICICTESFKKLEIPIFVFQKKMSESNSWSMPAQFSKLLSCAFLTFLAFCATPQLTEASKPPEHSFKMAYTFQCSLKLFTVVNCVAV